MGLQGQVPGPGPSQKQAQGLALFLLLFPSQPLGGKARAGGPKDELLFHGRKRLFLCLDGKGNGL